MPLGWCHLHIWGYWYFSLQSWFQLVLLPAQHFAWCTLPSFRVCNSSAGIPSPLLPLFIVKLPKAHLTLHSKMSGSRWVVTPLWLFGSLRSFLCSSSVSSYHLFLISSASVRSLLFLSFILSILAWNVPLVSRFLEEISTLSHSSAFLYIM